MELTAQSILNALREGMPQAGPARLQEARSGKIVRVADMKYLKEAKGVEGLHLRMNPGVAAQAEKLEPLFLNESFDDWDSIADLASKHYLRMGEATSASAFGQLMRAGVQTITNDYYLRTPVSWTEYFREYASDKRQEFHAPLFRSSLPQLVRPGQPYAEQPVIGQDIELINQKFMGGESFEAELWEDDMTGQIRQRAQSLGEAQRIFEEIYCTGIIFGLNQGGSAALNVANFSVPAPTWTGYNAAGTAINTVYNNAMFNTGVGNQLATFSQLGASVLKQAMAGLMKAIDPKGIRILVRPNHLVVSVQDALNVDQLLGSDLNPAIQGPGGTQYNAQLGGAIGGIMAKNVFKGKLTFSVAYFAPDWAWVLGEKGKGPVFQRRSPMSVVQEIPNSGQSFELDVMRWRTRSRFIPGWIDPRFWFRGNDGSASGQQ